MMLSAGRGEASGIERSEKSRNGPIGIGRDILRNEGVKGLFRGGLIRAGWTAMALGLYLSLYEGGRMFLENRRLERNDLPRGSVGEGDEVA
jgi:hypothetical protein